MRCAWSTRAPAWWNPVSAEATPKTHALRSGRLRRLELVVLVGALALPAFLDDYLVVLATKIAILCLVALSFDLVWGYAGIMSFGQSVMFGAGGYGIALLARDQGITSALVVLPVAALLGILLSLFLSALLLLGRRPLATIFVALGTLTAAYAFERFAMGWYFLGGHGGIPSIPALTVLGREVELGRPFYFFALAVLATFYLLMRWMTRSSFGLALAGLREGEGRMAYLGFRVQHLKVIAFITAGAAAGVAGGLYALHEGFVWPKMLGVVIATQIVLYVILGGSGTLIGAVIGTVTVEVLSFFLSDQFQHVWPILLGMLLLIVVLFRPSGLVSLITSERERIGDFSPREMGSREA